MSKQRQNTFTDEELILQYNKMPFLSKLAAHFEVPEISIFRRSKRLGLKYKNGGSQKSIPLSEILEGKHPHFQTNKLKKKILKEGIFENICSECGIKDWNGKDLIFHLDHIN